MYVITTACRASRVVIVIVIATCIEVVHDSLQAIQTSFQRDQNKNRKKLLKMGKNITVAHIKASGAHTAARTTSDALVRQD